MHKPTQDPEEEIVQIWQMVGGIALLAVAFVAYILYIAGPSLEKLF